MGRLESKPSAFRKPQNLRCDEGISPPKKQAWSPMVPLLTSCKGNPTSRFAGRVARNRPSHRSKRPQQYARIEMTAQVLKAPRENFETSRAATREEPSGSGSVVPMPSWPSSFAPQQRRFRFSKRAQPWRLPRRMEVISQRHEAEQPSPVVVLPSSHSSSSTWTNPSPQVGCLQWMVQSSLEFSLPSSHSSRPSTTPLPHTGFLHEVRQSSSSDWLPSSHSSCSAWT